MVMVLKKMVLTVNTILPYGTTTKKKKILTSEISNDIMVRT